MVASAKLPTSIEPAEFSVTTPPVNVVSDSVQPPTFPPVNDTSEPVIWPLYLAMNLPSSGLVINVGPVVIPAVFLSTACFNCKKPCEVVELNVVLSIENPPIVPPAAFMSPDISNPAEEADNTVVLASVFISNASLVIFTCWPIGDPIVVVAPNDALVAPLRMISKLSESNTALLSESLIIWTSNVEADMWAPAVLPIVAPFALNLPTTVVLSFSSNPALDIFTCSAFCNPTNTLVPNSLSLSPLLFKTFNPSLVNWTAEAIEAESDNVPAILEAAEAENSPDEPLIASANCAELETKLPTVRVPPKVAVPSAATENWFPILIPLASIISLSVLPSFNLKLPESINVWALDTGPMVVVAPKEAVTCVPLLISTESLSIWTFWFVPVLWPTVTVVPKLAKVRLAAWFFNDIPSESKTTWVAMAVASAWAALAVLIPCPAEDEAAFTSLANEADTSPTEPLIELAKAVPIVKAPENVASPEESTVNWFPILIPLASIWSLTLFPSFSLKLPESMSVWEASVDPMVVTAPNEADVFPFNTISKLSASILEKLSSSLLMWTAVVEAEIWPPAVFPIVAPLELNFPTTVLESFIVKPVESTKTCSAEVWPSLAVEPKVATLLPPCVIVNPLAFTTALLLASCMISTESLSILTCSALVLPTVVVAPNEAKVVSVPPESTIRSTELLSIKILDLSSAFSPIVTVVP